MFDFCWIINNQHGIRASQSTVFHLLIAESVIMFLDSVLFNFLVSSFYYLSLCDYIQLWTIHCLRSLT